MTSLDIWMSGNHFKDMVHPIIQFLFIYLDYFGASSSSGFNVIFLKKNYFSCFRLTLHTSASWIRFLSDCSRKLKAYSWVLASTITSLACFTSICVAQHKCHPSKHLYYYKSLLCILLSLKKKKKSHTSISLNRSPTDWFSLSISIICSLSRFSSLFSCVFVLSRSSLFTSRPRISNLHRQFRQEQIEIDLIYLKKKKEKKEITWG